MAWIFSLSAECGAQPSDAEDFREHFQGLVLTLSTGQKISISPNNCVQNPDGSWWSVIVPQGMVIGGGQEDPELMRKEYASEVGFLLYEHLKSAPPFRYAIVGLEVDGFLEESEFETRDWQTYDGIVLSKEFCERFDHLDSLEKFTPNYYWRPYLGEKKDF